jgi:hypothetical protein
MRDTCGIGIALGMLLTLSAISAVYAADVDQLLRLEQYRSAPAVQDPVPPPMVPAAKTPSAVFTPEPGVLYAYG